jgi:hypothetical protein
MNTIRIDRLDLKCRGIQAATAQAALCELGPALRHHLGNGACAATGPNSAGKESAAIRVPARVTPATLAGAVAERVMTVVHAGGRLGNAGRKS